MNALNDLSYARVRKAVGYKSGVTLGVATGIDPTPNRAAKIAKKKVVAEKLKPKKMDVPTKGTCKARPDGRKPSSLGAGKSRDFIPYCERGKK